MTAPRFIEIGGKLFLWRDIVLRQEQCRTASEAEPVQPPLFELDEDFPQPNAPPPRVTSNRLSFR